MNIEDVRNSLLELIEITHPLAEDDPVPGEGTDYLRVMEGVFRKNFIRLQSAELLTQHETTSNVAIEVVRNMTEDVVGLEYIRLKGTEKYSKRFFDYLPVQKHQELQLINKFDIDIPEEAEQKIEEEYKNVEGKLKKRSSWSGCSLECQIEHLRDNHDSSSLNERDLNLIRHLYVFGSNKTHFNPHDIAAYLSQELFEYDTDISLKLALIFSISAHVRITTRYVDEINRINNNTNYKRYGEQANKILRQYEKNTDKD